MRRPAARVNNGSASRRLPALSPTLAARTSGSTAPNVAFAIDPQRPGIPAERCRRTIAAVRNHSQASSRGAIRRAESVGKLSNLRRQGNLDLVDIAVATGERLTLASIAHRTFRSGPR